MPPVESPCILVCVLDQATGWCLGCGRTGEEIAAWPDANDNQRRAVMELLPLRMAELARASTPTRSG